MKALILSCNTGGGHNSAGKAVAEAMTWQGDEAYVMDYLTLAGEGVSKLVGDGYVQIVKKTPKLFGVLYKLGMAVSRLTRKSPVYYVNGRMAKYLNQYIKEHPVDVIVMPHLYPAETITYMKRKGMKLPLTVAVMTDYTCIPFWEETDCDYYIVPHENLMKSCIRRGLPEEKLIPLGIPVSRLCTREISKEDARKKLGLCTEKKYILVAGGSMGAGDMKKLVECLLKSTTGEELIIVCGNNQKVEARLKKSFGGEKRATILGFTTQMSLYMKACDVPDWYIESCQRIKYMFPKAHAAAYVMMAMRVAWFKVHRPLAYYAAYFSIRATAFNYELMCLGRERLEYYMADYNKRSNELSDKEKSTLEDMKIVQEMYARGFEFEKLDIYRAKATRFQIVDGKLMPSFSTIDGLGGKAAELIEAEARKGKFLSREDFKNRCKVSANTVEAMADMGLMGDLPHSNQMSLLDFM